jgi:hypothetical protein
MNQKAINHHKYAREGAAKVGSVDVWALLLGDVDLLAAGTEDLHSAGTQFFAHAYREDVLSLAEDSGAGSEASLHELLLH